MHRHAPCVVLAQTSERPSGHHNKAAVEHSLCPKMLFIARLVCFALVGRVAAIRLVTTAQLPGVPPSQATDFLATPANWPKVVLSSHSVKGVDGVDVTQPLQPGGEVDEIFGLPPILPLRVRWQCTAAVDETANGGSAGLTFASPTGLEGIATNCGMAFEVTSDGAGGSAVELAMTYDPSSPLARLAAPVLVVDNALALKFLLKRNMRGTGSE
jgi:hypothetical protein